MATTSLCTDHGLSAMISLSEIANQLSVSHETVRRLCLKGILLHTKIGKRWLVHREDLLNFLYRNRVR
jgi:excisionase family DNA binding protein